MYSPNSNEKYNILQLETFMKEYDNTMIEYQQAYSNYINYLQTNVSNAGPDNILLAIGTDGNLWYQDQSKGYLNSASDNINTYHWTMVNDDSNGNFIAVATNQRTHKVYGVNQQNNIYYKNNYNDPNWRILPGSGTCCLFEIAVCPDGTLLGVGLDNRMWRKTSPDDTSSWISVAPVYEWVSDVAVAPDGSVYVIGGNNYIYMKPDYKTLEKTPLWNQVNNSCCVKAITITTNGTVICIGMDQSLYTKPTYTNFSNDYWRGPYINSCCIRSITTVSNSKKYTDISGNIYSSSNVISSTNGVNTPEDCSALCNSIPLCSGATFHSNKQQCIVQGGDGNVLSGLTTDYAILSQEKMYKHVLSKLNDKLLSLNKQMLDMENKNSNLRKNDKEGRLKQEILLKNYKNLLIEKEKVNKSVEDYESLDISDNNDHVIITEYYYTYIFYFLFVILLSVLFYLSIKNVSESRVNINTQLGGKTTNFFTSLFK